MFLIVHFDCCFTRYRLDGSIIGTYESIYIVTKDENNHFLVRFPYLIFKPYQNEN